MKKILIVAEYFAPYNTIAAIRLTKLAKYFKLNSNYDITVISRDVENEMIIDPILQENLKYIDNHIIINYSEFILKLVHFRDKLRKKRKVVSTQIEVGKNARDINKKESFFKHIISSIKRYIVITIDKIINQNYVDIALKKIKPDLKDYDVILSTFGPMASHFIAFEIKKYNPNILWIADFRDPVVRSYSELSKEIINYYKKYIKKISNKADLITGVTQSCIQDSKKICNGKQNIICNGFDRDDIKNISATISHNKFTLTYTGKLYKNKGNIDIIFKAISELINEKKINKEKIQINYAGIHETYFQKQSEEYKLLEAVQIYGFINRKQALALQLNSNVLLVGSYNNHDESALVTGKFLEYLMINKPIVCSVTGNLAGSQLKEMITQANNGIVWEEANDEVDYPILKSYILEQYNRFINNEPPLFEPNMEYIEKYNYKNIAQQFIDLIENNMKDK